MPESQLNRMLIVDDDATFTKIQSRTMKKRGFDVEMANNIKDGISLAKAFRPECAIVDLKMQQETGLTLISELKSLLPDIRIVMLTGYSSIATAVEAVKRGALNYLPKPASADDILRALELTGDDPDIEIPNAPPSVDRIEWEHIQRVLAEHDGNISATARALKMHRRTLQRKLAKRPVRA